jgi:hypothetical protein
MFRRLTVVLGTAVLALAALVAPASAATAPAARDSVATGTSADAIACSAFAGHYCARVFFTSVAGGIRVNQTRSTGYTTGAGRAREYFRYSCAAGTCYILPSATFFYSHRLVQLNVTRTFAGSGRFLPCGNRFGVDYINPAVNAPGPRPVLFTVTCRNGAGQL